MQNTQITSEHALADPRTPEIYCAHMCASAFIQVRSHMKPQAAQPQSLKFPASTRRCLPCSPHEPAAVQLAGCKRSRGACCVHARGRGAHARLSTRPEYHAQRACVCERRSHIHLVPRHRPARPHACMANFRCAVASAPVTRSARAHRNQGDLTRHARGIQPPTRHSASLPPQHNHGHPDKQHVHAHSNERTQSTLEERTQVHSCTVSS